jgi:hypothetical protein
MIWLDDDESRAGLLLLIEARCFVDEECPDEGIDKLTSGDGTKRTSRDVRSLVAIGGGKADMAVTSADFRF